MVFKRGNVADDGAEVGHQRQEPVRHLWVRQLSDGVGMVAQASQCDEINGRVNEQSQWVIAIQREIARVGE